MAELTPLPDLVRGRYRHFKGGEYEVIDIVRSSETLEPMVLYRALYGEGGLWVRPTRCSSSRFRANTARRRASLASTIDPVRPAVTRSPR